MRQKQNAQFKQTEIGMIPEDWEIKCLGTEIDIIGGGTPKTSNPEYWGGDIPWISVTDFGSGRWIYHTEKQITEKGLNESSTKILHKGQIIISARGTVGEVRQIGGDMAFNQSCYGIDGKKIVNNDYLYSLLKYKVKELQRQGHGAVFNTITRNTFNNIFVALPNHQEQTAIAKILSDLDSKIELNQQMNKTLEAIGQAIFKRWFIDFEFPNEKGKPYKSSGGEMVDSELGKIPKGWIFGEFADILADIESGSRPKGGIDSSETEIPSIGAENIDGIANHDYSKEKYISREFFERMKQGIVKNNDVLMYKDGAKIGRISFFDYDYPHKECAINEHVFILRFNDKVNQEFLYLWLDRPNMTQSIINLNSNAAQPGINQTQVKTLPILIPNKEVLNQFQSTISKIFHKIFENAKQNQNLAQIRDSLLPRLMSGKIRVPVEVQT